MNRVMRPGFVVFLLGLLVLGAITLPGLSRAAGRNALALATRPSVTGFRWDDPAQVCAPSTVRLEAMQACSNSGECYLTSVQALRTGKWDAVQSLAPSNFDPSDVFLQGWGAWCGNSQASAIAIWQRANVILGERFLNFGELNLGSALPAAIRDLEIAKALNPTVETQFALGHAYDLAGDTGRALDVYHAALVGQTVNAGRYWQVAELEYRMHDYANARTHIQHAVELEPNDWLNWQVDGNVLLQLQDWVGAEKAFGRVVQLNPTYGHGNAGLGLALAQQGRIAEGEAPLLNAVQLIDDARQKGGYLAAFADIAAKWGDTATAIGFYERAVMFQPENNGFWGALIAMYLKVGDCTHANEAYQRLSEIQKTQNKPVAPPPECPVSK